MLKQLKSKIIRNLKELENMHLEIANNSNFLKFHQMLKLLENIVFQEVMLKQLKSKRKGCFSGSNVETIKIENNSKLERIGRSAFKDCKQLKSIKIPSNVESIGKGCFSGSNVETVEIENNSKLERIGECAFSDCEQLKFLKIPSNVESIGNSCFSESNVEEIHI